MMRDQRGSASSRGYDRKWRKVREAKRRANPLCEDCEARDRVVPMDVVDHVVPIEERPDLRLDWNNLRSLCRDCHEMKHGRQKERPELGPDGLPARSLFDGSR